jgi:hypothetical protein
MPVVDVAMVSSSSNIFSIKSIMPLVMQKIVEMEMLLCLSAGSKTVSTSFQEVALLLSKFCYEHEMRHQHRTTTQTFQ